MFIEWLTFGLSLSLNVVLLKWLGVLSRGEQLERHESFELLYKNGMD